MPEHSECSSRWRWLKREIETLQNTSPIFSLRQVDVLQLNPITSLDVQKAREMISNLALALDDIPKWISGARGKTDTVDSTENDIALFEKWHSAYRVDDIGDVLRHCQLLTERMQMLRLCEEVPPMHLNTLTCSQAWHRISLQHGSVQTISSKPMLVRRAKCLKRQVA